MIDSILDIFPRTGQVAICVISSVIGASVNVLFGWNEALEALLWLMVLDYISGVMAAYINPKLALNSQRGFKGILKKVSILLIIALAHLIDHATGAEMAETIVVWFFLGNEGLSIIENAAKAGVPIPDKLKKTLEQLINTDSKK